MSRAFVTINETNPNLPTPELHINSHVFSMSERELLRLAEEIQWAIGHMSGVRIGHWNSLAMRYKEVENVKQA